MIGRLLPWRKRAQLLALGLSGLLLAGHVTPAQAQTLPVCAVDLDGNGVQTVGLAGGVTFDLNATGTAVNTGISQGCWPLRLYSQTAPR